MKADLKFEILQSLPTIPTADNTQPWKVSFQSSGLNLFVDLYHTGSLAQHTLNSFGVASIFSMGFVIETFELIGKKCGYKLNVKFQQESWSKLDSDLMVPVAKLSFVFDRKTILNTQEANLLEQLAVRHTNRNVYKQHTWSDDVFAQLNKSSNLSDSKITYFSTKTNSVINYIAQTESIMWKESNILNQILKWIRFTDQDVKSHKNGLNGNGLGFHGLEWNIVKFVTQNKVVLNLVRPFISKIIGPMKTKIQLKSSTALAAVSVKTVNLESLVQSGRLMMKQWLLLTQMGYAIHPYTLGSLNIFNLKNHTLADVLQKKHLSLLQKGDSLFKKVLGLSDSESVVFFFRLGLAEELPESCRSKKQNPDYFLVNIDKDQFKTPSENSLQSLDMPT